MGPATLVQAGGMNLLFDAGRGAAVRVVQAGISVGQIDAVFLTHFHSDHVNGLSDVWMSGYIPVIGGRKSALPLYGPTGVRTLARGLMIAHGGDAKVRIADEGVPVAATRLEPHEFKADGVVFERKGVKVTAFAVDHGKFIKPAVGYRIDYAGHSVVLSGDTRFDPAVIKNATGVDLLIHEVAAIPGGADPANYRAVLDHHIAPEEAGRVFTQAHPKLAVYSHIVRPRVGGQAPISLEEIETLTRQTYNGPLVMGADLMRFAVGQTVAVTTVKLP
jgi:ribonuclease Z